MAGRKRSEIIGVFEALTPKYKKKIAAHIEAGHTTPETAHALKVSVLTVRKVREAYGLQTQKITAEMQEDIYRMRYEEGMTYRQIAAYFDVVESSIKYHCNVAMGRKARLQLQEAKMKMRKKKMKKVSGRRR